MDQIGCVIDCFHHFTMLKKNEICKRREGKWLDPIFTWKEYCN